MGLDLPRRLRADAAPQRRADRLPARLHHLRRRRQPAARRARPRRPRRRPEAVPAPRRARRHQLGQVGPDRRSALRRSGPGRSTSERIAQAYAEYERRLVAANAMDFDDLLVRTVRMFRDHPDVLEQYSGALRARARRRVPGHERRPERARDPARRGAAQRLRRRRHRPEHLPLPGRRDAQPARVRAGLPRRPRDRARPELPLHPDDPRRRQRGDRATTCSARRRTSGARSARASRIRRYRAGDDRDEASFVTSEIADPAAATRASATATSPSSTGPTPRAAPSRRRWPIGGSPTR